MKYVSIVDAKEQLSDLIKFLHDNPHEEVYLTFNNKPIVKMTPITEDSSLVEEKTNPNRRRFGIAKGQFTFDDELFDALDADIDKMFFGEAAQ